MQKKSIFKRDWSKITLQHPKINWSLAVFASWYKKSLQHHNSCMMSLINQNPPKISMSRILSKKIFLCRFFFLNIMIVCSKKPSKLMNRFWQNQKEITTIRVEKPNTKKKSSFNQKKKQTNKNKTKTLKQWCFSALFALCHVQLQYQWLLNSWACFLHVSSARVPAVW